MSTQKRKQQRNKKKQFPHFYSFVFYISHSDSWGGRWSHILRFLSIQRGYCSLIKTDSFTCWSFQATKNHCQSSPLAYSTVSLWFTRTTMPHLSQWQGCFLNTSTWVTAGTQKQGRHKHDELWFGHLASAIASISHHGDSTGVLWGWVISIYIVQILLTAVIMQM